ncbi:Peroxidase [Rhynchospora pubera]|uniref:Peroxidase n=1 Tax=Rhynchospora pubera TaxID=906938 RepID=A0AAV8CRY5_9POAL|nr:Peroxidase [Rhynchospora pubera]
MKQINACGVLLVVWFIFGSLSSVQGDLKIGFYDESCPQAEKIISEYVKKHIPHAPTLAAPLLRMHFHDCFVRGCDASLLLNSSSQQAEKDAIPNKTLRGFDFIDRIKSLLEKECPGIVSCADILSLVARDAVVTIGGPTWKVPTGRRDGTVSNKKEALQDIPAPNMNFSQLITSFGKKGLDLNDLVWLSGAHTIGIGHCNAFSKRLYNFTGKFDQDPSIDPFYAANLKKYKCKSLSDNTTFVEMDPGSFLTFDNDYYKNLLKRRGLFTSDAALITNATAKAGVTTLANSSDSVFFTVFAISMEKMNQIEVKTGSEGEIRKHCALVN